MGSYYIESARRIYSGECLGDFVEVAPSDDCYAHPAVSVRFFEADRNSQSGSKSLFTTLLFPQEARLVAQAILDALAEAEARASLFAEDEEDEEGQ